MNLLKIYYFTIYPRFKYLNIKWHFKCIIFYFSISKPTIPGLASEYTKLSGGGGGHKTLLSFGRPSGLHHLLFASGGGGGTRVVVSTAAFHASWPDSCFAS